MLIKLGELHEVKLESSASIPDISPEVLENFRKIAFELKKIAPKADDFLYFSASMLHSAEASAINDDGSPKLTASGEPVVVGWDTSNDTWKWVSNDPNIKPYKNANSDIFPESELIKAHKKWIHKPLCVDHKSSSVDHTRGFIVDTYYDRNLKRVIALCALDKANYPDLARKIATRMQTAVSMGTGVGKAICYDCGRVARVEADFCHHMKTKSGYGEINIDLNPMELSIVVNGADPKANIKMVIAAANTMNSYLENRAKKLAGLVYHADITVGNSDGGLNNKNQAISINSTDLHEFKVEVEEAFKKLEEFKSININDFDEKNVKDDNNNAFNQSSGSISMDEGTPTDSGLALQTPQTLRLAEIESLTELKKVVNSIETTLGQMKQGLDKLSIKKQEENMSGSDKLNKNAYFQGAGGVNEPTPGQVKYPKDPLNEELREKGDKQMVGQSPFPEVGPVDGMHPSPASVDPSDELERKKMLARAELEDRAIRRNAIVELAKKALNNKQGYFQGGGGVNEPTPGKVKYPKDKLNEEDREHEDKQMVGQPPFPGVGPVDGLHPSPASADVKDELKRKEMLARASLRARFVKAANIDGSQNKAKSAWEVFLGDRLLLTASVDDLCGGNVSEVMYDNIATKTFGTKLIERVKLQGAEAVNKMIKRAQVAPPAEQPAPMDSTPEAAPVEDAGKAGDPKQQATELAEKVRDLSSDLVEAIRALTGEQAEMGADNAPTGGVAAPMSADDQFAKKKKNSEESLKEASNFGTNSLNTIRRELNGGLIQAMKEALAELKDYKQELDTIVEIYSKSSVNDSNRDMVAIITEDAINESKTALANGFKLMQSFVKYARGTQAIVKRAEVEEALQSLGAEGDSMSDNKEDSRDNHSAGDLMNLIHDTNSDLDAVHEMMSKSDDNGDLGDLGDLETLLSGDEDLEPKEEESDHKDEEENDNNDSVNVETADQANQILAKNPDAAVSVNKNAAFDSKAGRALLRAKIAADATGKQETGEIQDASKLKFSDMLDQSDGLADGQTHLDVKPSVSPGPSAKFPLGLVETPEESLKAMMDVAKAPPKVRKEAEAIQRLISEGKLDPKDVDALVAEGLDKDAVTYWKKYWGEVDGGSEFATELVKEHVKAEMEKELNTYRVKMARAYELTYDMVDRGLCRNERATISDQVDQIMKFNDENFESLKRVVAKHPMGGLKKSAGVIPSVGFRDESESPVQNLTAQDEYATLSSMLGVKKSMF